MSMLSLILLSDIIFFTYTAYRLHSSFFKKYNRAVVVTVIILTANSFLISMAFTRLSGIDMPHDIFKFIPMVILALYVYIFMLYAVTDIIKIIFKILHKPFISNRLQGAAVVIISVFICLFGYFNAHNTKISKYSIKIDKHISSPIKIAALADIHIGSDMAAKRLENEIKKINNLNPDIIFIAGDIIDNNINDFTEEYINILNKFTAPLGIYTVFGNHEHYSGGKETILSLFNKAGFKTLIDETVYIPEKDFYIIGRNSLTHNNTYNIRADIEKFANRIDKNKLVIILDHIPLSLQDGKKISADMQISGHTHNGQFFPINLIVKNMYDISHGMKNYDGLYVFVTSGLGLWGPPVRVGTDSEIMLIEVSGK